MQSPPILCLLPGLDGTGDLYRPLTDALAGQFPLQRFAYPRDRFLDYRQLADQLATELPQGRDFVLVSESFAGPLAIRLAARRPPGLRAMVLAASFAAQPLPGSRWLARMLRAMPTPTPPMPLLSWGLCGDSPDPALLRELERLLRQLPAPLLKARAIAALKVDATAELRRIDVPLLYLVAERDRLIYPAAGRRIAALAKDSESIAIDAPHFLYQTQPIVAAQAIVDFLERRLGCGDGSTSGND